MKASTTLSMEEKADIYALHFIAKSRASTKSVNQSLTRNSSFNSFGLDLPKVMDRLKKRKLVEVVETKLKQNGRVKKQYRTLYDNINQEHKDFFQKFQYIFPGETFANNENIDNQKY